MVAIPEVKAAAHRLVREALRAGDLYRPDRCENCGLDGFGNVIVAHHPDYSKPLDVEWLCYSCHGFAHAPEPRRAPTPWPAGTRVPPGLLTFAEARALYGVAMGLIVTCVARGLLKHYTYCARGVVEPDEMERVFVNSRHVRRRREGHP